MGGLVLTTTTALGASVLAAGPVQAAAPQRTTLAAAPTATVTTKTLTAKQARIAKQRKRADYAVKYAAKQIGDPYRYGGTGPGSWDCSGLAGGSWRKAGVKLPRTTQQIYKAVHKKVSWKGAVKGDLLFFYGGRTHMGVYAGHGYMIHAPSSGKRVKKIKLNGYYKRNFHGAVRPGT
ncbi:cell wall-associated NlpC family hydrolase [Actinomadura luteofluorescens]|uniref:Cell wall-associated NlpC family hydrolase n=1 Tax=Actinomadura luteofluorescens TaxID=46163 RepID=A0A7Y9EGM1_9ACTN|nr:C40 family peptidase [Actinomadura luteofluorescens]NYD47339.1 cell wall-associated NlpC family hydrolase [Actinomadura luteofluorescens]